MVASVFPCITLSFVNKQGHINPSIQFSRSVMSDSLRPYGLQHTRLPCPSPTPGACWNSCPLSQRCHPNISSCHPLFLLPSIFPSIRVFSNELALCLRWPSNEYSGLISFRMDWLDLLAVQETRKSLLQHHSSKASILRRSAFFSCVQFFATLQTVAHQAPLSIGLSRQEYWSELLWTLPGDLPNPGTEPMSPAFSALQVDS